MNITLRNKISNNKKIIKNIIGSFGVKGGALLVSLFTMPAYIKYFQDQTVLGVWFTIISVLNWAFIFDLGIGNGLRNKLPEALAEKDDDKVQRYISSTYITVLVIVVLLYILGFFISSFIQWNNIFNIDSSKITNDTLMLSVRIVFLGIMVQIFLKLITSILYALQNSALANFLSLASNTLILICVVILPRGNLEYNLITMSWINVFAINCPLALASIITFSTYLKNCKPIINKFTTKYAKEIIKIGSIFLWAQLTYMIISLTNEFLISNFATPNDVVEYQSYYKIFNAISSFFALALVPIWSAVTKAQTENNYKWIKKLNHILLCMCVLALMLEISIVPFFQNIINVWLGVSYISAKVSYATIFAIYNSILVLHAVNTSFSNGMSYFRIQIIWMTFAAVVDIPLAYLFVYITGGWIGVIIANIISLLPFEIIHPIYFEKYINKQIKLE